VADLLPPARLNAHASLAKRWFNAVKGEEFS
jgi:hypothetical protein